MHFVNRLQPPLYSLIIRLYNCTLGNFHLASKNAVVLFLHFCNLLQSFTTNRIHPYPISLHCHHLPAWFTCYYRYFHHYGYLNSKTKLCEESNRLCTWASALLAWEELRTKHKQALHRTLHCTDLHTKLLWYTARVLIKQQEKWF